jgi:hypothetical protein
LRDHRIIVCAGDVIPKLIVLHAKAAVACLDLRVPPYGRDVGKKGTPSGSGRQVIGRCEAKTENSRTIVGRVARKKDIAQAAAIETLASDVGDAAGNRNTGQISKVFERRIRDARDWQVIGDGGDGQGSSCPGVTGDSESIVRVSNENQIGLRGWAA